MSSSILYTPVLSTLARKTEEVGPTGINLMEASESWSELL